MKKSALDHCLSSAVKAYRDKMAHKSPLKVMLRDLNPQEYAGQYEEKILHKIYAINGRYEEKKRSGYVLLAEKGLYSSYLNEKSSGKFEQPVLYEALAGVKKSGQNIRFNFVDGTSVEAWFGPLADATAVVMQNLADAVAREREEEKKFCQFSTQERAKALGLFRQAKTAFGAQQYQKARSLLEQVLPYHMAKAEYMAGACLYHGLGGDTDIKAANDLFARASLHEYGEGSFELARQEKLYRKAWDGFSNARDGKYGEEIALIARQLHSDNPEKNGIKCMDCLSEEEIAAILETAARQGSKSAAYRLGQYWWKKNLKKGEDNNYVPDRDWETAFSWFEKAWQLGEKTAAGNIGLACELGLGTPKNLSKAVQWYERLSMEYAVPHLSRLATKVYNNGNDAECVRILEECWKAGDAEITCLYGDCFLNGRGKPKDPAKAVLLYTKALKEARGYYPAMTRLALCYENGYGVTQDLAKARKLYLYACMYDENAVNRLITLADNAMNTGNSDMAVEIYTELAKRDIALGEYRLGQCYDRGTGVEHNPVAAAELYGRAANNDCVDAILDFARCLVNGKGCPRCYYEAGKWYLHATFFGRTVAERELEQLRRRITDTDGITLKQQQAEWEMHRRNRTLPAEILGSRSGSYIDGMAKPQIRPAEIQTFEIPLEDTNPLEVSNAIALEKDKEDLLLAELEASPAVGSGLPLGSHVKVKHFELPRWLFIIPLIFLVLLVRNVKNDLTEYEARQVPYDAVELNGHYYYVYDDASSWYDAWCLCQEKGGYLACITSQEENDFVRDYLNKKRKTDVFMGLYNAGYMYDQDWKWVSGEPFEFSAWSDGEPNASNGGYEFYGCISSGGWNDCLYSGGDRNYYLCEWNSLDTEVTFEGYVLEYNGHYYKGYSGAESWDDARQLAEEKGGYLVCITSQEEETAVRGFMHLGGGWTAYIGLYNSGADSSALEFSWVDGEPVEYTDWMENNPDNNGGELYVAFNETGYWNDVTDGVTENYIVEWDSKEDMKN